ncbi:MAG: hypothetical protein ACRCZF_10525 [Gemmataceae bacterium]
MSRVVRLPSDNTTSGGRGGNLPLLNGDPTGDLRTPRLGDDLPGNPQIYYVNTQELTIKPKLMHVTRSGVKAVHLFVKDPTTLEWKLGSKKEVTIRYEQADPAVEINHKVTQDGRYGFIVIPESGAGKKEPDPVRNSPPQYLVEVDTKEPVVSIKDVLVTPGGAVGPRVEIIWEANDPNMMPDPILLEYAADKNATKWTSIAEKVANSRRYVWEVQDKQLYEFYVRIRAVDKAGNTGESIYPKIVNIDLDRPSATIENIRGVGSLAPSKSDRMPIPGALQQTPVKPLPPGK